ncbi:MAG: 16S rRNA (guanine(527)-N(7))-methyltransferase RsmG [Oscillospiraceae bacterium]
MDKKSVLIDVFKNFNIDVDDNKLEKLIIYADFLVEYNNNVNLTAIVDFRQICIKHFVDSYMLFEKLNLENCNLKVADVGTGAGFPGVVLKIINDDINLCLIDSTKKKVDFLNILVQKLNLDNVQVIHSRAEDIANMVQYREKFDIVTARAVTALSPLSEYCIPLVKLNGLFAPLKGKFLLKEIEESKNAIDILGAVIEKVMVYTLEHENDRGIVLIRKDRQTLTKYPRVSAKISKSPL